MSRGPVRQRGATMAELLVSMAVGLVVLLAAGALLVSSSRSYAAQAEAAALDDGGRFALELIARALRQPAHRDWERVDLAAGLEGTAPPGLAGFDDKTLGKASDGISDPLNGSVNGSDVLAVRFEGAGPAPNGDGSVTDCAGFPAHENAAGWSIFYVSRNGQGEAELRCKYRGADGWSADAVVSGVDGFQVLYGVDTDATADGVANRYVNASAVDALDAGLVLQGESDSEREQDRLRRTHWKRIVSVKVALLLHAAQPRQERAGRTSYRLFGSAYDAAAPGDRGTLLNEAALATDGRARERRLVVATVALRGAGR